MPLNNFFISTVSVIAIVGLQWGDEGNGKFIDWFAQWADIVARGTGGANAGHSTNVNEKEHVFHLMPSAIAHDAKGTINIIGNGVMLDPFVMISEMAELDEAGMTYNHLKIAFNAKLALPHHMVLDRVREAQKKGGKIGTTGRGIGPAYTDHVSRDGLTVVDMLNPDELRRKLTTAMARPIAELKQSGDLAKEIMRKDVFLAQFICHGEILDTDEIIKVYLAFGRSLKKYVTDTDKLLREAVAAGKKILLEGAQAALLSIDFGIYPMVTSSDSTPAGLAKGVGLTVAQIDCVYGIVKAPYMTKVGGGTFPTELGPSEDEDYPTVDINSANALKQCVAIRKAGNEYGATTGRPRRLGWLDLPLLRYALLSGGDKIILTKVDVLDEVRAIPICTHYQYTGPDYDFGDWVLKKGAKVDVAFGNNELMRHMMPVYRVFPGWKISTKEARSYYDLPLNLTKIIDFIEYQAKKPVAIVSVDPQRDQTVSK